MWRTAESKAPAIGRLLVAALALLVSGHPALGACDLNEVIGYQLVFAKQIDGFIEDGKRQHGFSGCTRDRVLVFADNTGVRCKETFVQQADRPRGYLFAGGGGAMKLCVNSDIYDVAPSN